MSVSVSIIVPVYNVEKYLRRCLDSLVNQTLEDIEIILINDASSDNSFAIMEEYKEKYKQIIIINSKKNLRQGGARNLGLKIATGEFIGFVDSDDWVSLDMYEMLYSKAMESDCDIVDSDYYVSDGINILEEIVSNTIDQLGELTDDIKKDLILHSGRMWTKIFNKELFTKNNIMFPENVFYEDNPVVPLLMCCSRHLEKVSKPLYFYYKNIESTTTITNSYHHFDRLITSELLIDEFKQRGLYEKYKDELDFRFSELFYINTVLICLLKFDKPELTYLTKMRKCMLKDMAGYRKNKYFYTVNKKVKLVTKINDISPRLLAVCFSIYKIIAKS